MIRTMARKNYSDEFRRQAVDLYESTPDATLKGIAADLGVSRGTLADWVRAFGTGSTAAPPEHSSSGAKSAGTESAAVRIARLEAENARLRADKVKVSIGGAGGRVWCAWAPPAGPEIRVVERRGWCG